MITGKHVVPKPLMIGDVAWEVATTDPPGFIPTGIGPLDELIVGATDGELLIVAGAPSQGKTALAMQIAETAAIGGVNVGMFSLEMGPAALSMRMIAAHSGVSITKLRMRAKVPLSAKDQDAVEAAAKFIGTLPIGVDSRSGLTGTQVYETVADWKKSGVGLILLDYIQLMEGDSESREEAIGSNTRQLKNAARDFALPFIALSQVNRAAGQREDSVPRMSDLRGSGQIEQVGDTILMFHYPNIEDKLEMIRAVDIHAVKQRQGPVGFASLYFNKPLTRFQTEGPSEKSDTVVLADGTKADTTTGEVVSEPRVWGA